MWAARVHVYMCVHLYVRPKVMWRVPLLVCVEMLTMVMTQLFQFDLQKQLLSNKSRRRMGEIKILRSMMCVCVCVCGRTELYQRVNERPIIGIIIICQCPFTTKDLNSACSPTVLNTNLVEFWFLQFFCRLAMNHTKHVITFYWLALLTSSYNPQEWY